MPWRALVEQDVLNRLANDERDTLESAGEDADPPETPRLPGILLQVTEMIRDAIRNNPANYLGADGEIPVGAVYHAATLCRLGLIGSQPTVEGETTPRQREESAAWDYVKRIQDGKITFAEEAAAPREAEGGTYGGKCLMEF